MRTLKPKRVGTIEVASFQDFNVEFKPHDKKVIRLELAGSGVSYKNEGKRLKDWLEVKNRYGKLSIKTFSTSDMKLTDFVNSKDKLNLTIHFPKTHTFKNIDVESVGGQCHRKCSEL